MKSPIECFNNVSEILTTLGEVNDEILVVSNELNIILLNLQLEGARIKQPNAVEVISKELRKQILTIREHLVKVLGRRQELIDTLKQMKEYLDELEKTT